MNRVLILTVRMINKDRWSYVLLIFELVLTSIIFLPFVGKLQAEMATKNIINVFNDRNACYFNPYEFFDVEKNNIKKILQKDGCSDLEVGEISDISLEMSNGKELSAYGYNDTIIDFVRLSLSQGSWFEKQEKDDCIPIISIDPKLKMNDIVEFAGSDDTSKVKGKVIGVMSREEYVMTFNSSGNNDFSKLSDFVSSPEADIIVPYQCKNYKSFTEKNIEEGSYQPGKILMTKKEKSLDKIIKICHQYGSISKINKMKENYQKDKRDFYISNGIVLAVFSLLSLAGIGGFNGIQSMLHERMFTIYYMLGLSKRRCMLMEGLRTFLLLIVSFGSVLILFYLLKFNRLFNADEYRMNGITFSIVFLFLCLICFVSSVGYVEKLARKNLIEVYKKKA